MRFYFEENAVTMANGLRDTRNYIEMGATNINKPFSRFEYYRGSTGHKYGVWNSCKKQFVFGICEDTPMLAEARLYCKIGDDARKWRFVVKKIVNDSV